MRYKNIPHALFVENRKNFTKQIKPGSLAVFNANDILPKNADGVMPFVQNSDLFYLSGIDQEETILVIFPDSRNEEHREILFIKETNEHVAVWEGNKLNKETASQLSGVKKVYWLSQFQTIFNTLMYECEVVYLSNNEHTKWYGEVGMRNDRFIKWCKERYPLHTYYRSAPIVHRLRTIKSSYEIKLIREACDITAKGFKRVLDFVKPGVKEYEIEAEVSHEFIRNGSRGFAYTPIIASGANSCILHYIQNDQVCRDGDILTVDIGAEYANYTSDLSRSLPVNGKFTKRQKDVYNAVLRVFNASVEMLTAGNTIKNYHKNVGRLMEEELIRLGLLKAEDVRRQNPETPLYKKYFMHGTSHFLGLDVHDVGDYNLPIEEGMVFTCEPGIYIREENLGIRIEDDILVTKKGPVNLMEHIPREAEEIEYLMQSKRELLEKVS